MIQMNRLRAGLLAAALVLVLVPALEPAPALAQSKGEAVRPEVGNPLQAAQKLTQSGRHREALAKISEAEAVGNKTAYETYLIQRMRGSVAAAAGDNDTAIRSFEAVIASGRVSGAEQLKMIQAVAGMHYRAKDYAKAASWAARYQKEGGSDPAMRTLLVQAYYLNNDCNAVGKLLNGGDTGRRPAEEELQILANCYLRQKDNGGYVATIEKLVTYYPKKDYWVDLLNRVQKKPGFSDRLALDVYRLKLATGNLTGTNDYMEMAQLAIQAGYPAEAKAIVDKGFANGALGAGKEGERHQRLKDLAYKQADAAQKARAQAEKDALASGQGGDLVSVGYNYVTEGLAAKGIGLMEQGIKKGGLKRPEDAKLLLGVAQVTGGQKSRGLQTLRSVHGTDGAADLARLWSLHAQRS